MVAAVGLVFLLAYLDLRREQARAYEDFTAEQIALARALASTLEARLAGAGERPFEHLLTAEAASPPMRCLVLDDAGRWVNLAPGGNPEANWQPGWSASASDVRALLERMASGAGGALPLDRSSAASLGLEQRTAVAGFAPVQLAGKRRWSIAVVTSAMRLRDRARISTWRLGAATVLAGLLVGLFGLLITREHKRAMGLAEALRLAEATAALRERSEKIVESIPVGVLALDAHLTVTTANAYLCERGAHAAGTLAEALPRATREDVQLLESLARDARTHRQPRMRAGLRLRFGSEDVREVDVWAIALERPLPDADSFLVFHDRTELRELERQLVRADKLATIGTLAAGIAHEVGTPLGIISGRAEQLIARLAEGEHAESMRKSLSSIMTQVDKVSSTIRQLLDFARVRPIEPTPVAPAQLLETAAALLDHHFRKAKVSLAIEASPAVPSVRGDAGQLEQVVVNLLMNAVDACESGGHIRATAARRGEQVAIEIIDDGCGIAKEHLGHVLDPFFTTKKRGQGTGLGLTIAADIIKNHGGALEIESQPARGTTVRLQLPLAERIA